MNFAQIMYTFFFAIYYAVTIATTRELQIFDTANMCYGFAYKKAWLRFFLGLFFVDILPLFFLWFTLQKLQPLENVMVISNFCSLLIIFFQSIIGFGLYRILFGILIIRQSDGSYFFYDNSIYSELNNHLDHPISMILQKRPRSHSNPWVHIIPGFVWVIITEFLLIILR